MLTDLIPYFKWIVETLDKLKFGEITLSIIVHEGKIRRFKHSVEESHLPENKS